jgi:exopolysaccharide biosynthesis polyprenyl glycosylphosphotransferase
MYPERKYVHLAYLVVDIILIAFSFYLPYSLRYSQGLIVKNFPNLQEYCLLFFLWGLGLVFFLNNHRLYSTDRSLTIPREIWQVIRSVFFSSILAGLAIFLLQMKFFSRFIFGLSSILLVLNLSLWRAIKRVLLRDLIKRGYYNINVIIVGAGRAGSLLVEEINNHPYLGLKVVGFIDDAKTGKILDYDILGKTQDLEEIIQRYYVDEIYITIPSQRQKVSEILALGKKLKKTVRIMADSFSFPFADIKLNYIGLIPLIRYSQREFHKSEILIKRFLDVVIASILLIILAPLFAIIAFLIKIDSPGPIFYISQRCGKKGRLFNFYKFRSMKVGADKEKELLREKSEIKGPVFKIRNDPRITRWGRFLRRYSLDELPQLVNVLKGEMSLVGPRPPTPDEVAKYDTWQMRRLEVKPGITCLWQVRGRSDLSFYKWVKWDLWYIDNWSLGLDLMILLWTIPAVLKRRGAY